MNEGMPSVKIAFKKKADTAIKRSSKGVVALILRDDITPFETKSYKKLNDVDKLDFTEDNYDLISKVFDGTPTKVIVEVVKTIGEHIPEISETLNRLVVTKFNYLVMPSATNLEKEEIASFIKNKNEGMGKSFKAVLAHYKADYECIINVTSDDIELYNKVYTAEEYTARFAGIFAGLGLDRSATYYVLPEVRSVEIKEDPDSCVKNGELILIDDGEKIKIGRAVNSLTTITATHGYPAKPKEFKKIKIIEGMHLMKDDVKTTFDDEFVGKYICDYDNKVLFTAYTSKYYKGLERAGVLDKRYENKAEIDVEQQRIYLESIGVDTEEMTEQQIKEYNTETNVFQRADVLFVDAMEDLQFNINM